MRNGPLNGIRLYLLWAAACALTGWALSVLHGLTLAGYVVALPLVMIGLAGLTRDPLALTSRVQRRWIQVLFRRFRRPLPLVFLVVLALAFAGGISHAPTNYDGLTYRLPRMLNWLSTRGWTWIFTNNNRMNYSGTSWEWMAMPLLALRSDRALFLINAIGFLLFPGLVFSVFRQAGVVRRAAWAWMWILPLAFGYALQAGSIGNDLPGVIFCLVSVHYGLRARHSGRVEDVWLAGLAAAIMTGVKSSNLPLLLPCLVAAGPALTHLRRRWAPGILMAIIALVISVIPTAVLNIKHTGSWTGDPHNLTRVELHNPMAAFLGNSLLLSQQSLMPPLLPGAQKANAWLNQHLPDSWKRELEKGFPRFVMNRLNELPQEESAGLGIGVTLLLFTALVAAIYGWGKRRRGQDSSGLPGLKFSSVGLAAWIAGLVFILKVGSEADARLMLPFYPLALIPILVQPGQDWLVRRVGWQIPAALVFLSILPGLILAPARPLWPAQSVSVWLSRHHPDGFLTQRMTTVYSCYAHRNDLLVSLRNRLPDTTTTIGFIADDNDSSYSLWRPFGRRRVVYLWDGTPESPVLLPPDVEWIVVRCGAWPSITDVPLETWATLHHIEIVSSVPIQTFAGMGEEPWSLLHVSRP